MERQVDAHLGELRVVALGEGVMFIPELDALARSASEPHGVPDAAHGLLERPASSATPTCAAWVFASGHVHAEGGAS